MQNITGDSQDGFAEDKPHLTNLVTFSGEMTVLVGEGRAADIAYLACVRAHRNQQCPGLHQVRGRDSEPLPCSWETSAVSRSGAHHIKKGMELLEQAATRIIILFLLEQKLLEGLNSSSVKTNWESQNCSAWRKLGGGESL